MKGPPFRWRPLIFPAMWALLPWFFWLVYRFHKPEGHADPFWLTTAPFVFASFVPALVTHSGLQGPDWFPMRAVVVSSAFNFAVGAFLVWRLLPYFQKKA